MPNTDYLVSLKYSLDDKAAAAALAGIADKADKAGRHVEGLKNSFSHLAGAVGLHFVGHEAKKVFVDFNSELEQMRIQLSTMIQLNFPVTLERATEKAGELFGEFQR